MDQVTVEHLGAEYYQDPNSVHARLQAQRPVSAVIMPGGFPALLVTGYAEACAALADPRLRKTTPGWSFGGLLERFGSMRLAVSPESLRWRPSTLIRGLETLPVRLVP